jgi:hypothetical protein
VQQQQQRAIIISTLLSPNKAALTDIQQRQKHNASRQSTTNHNKFKLFTNTLLEIKNLACMLAEAAVVRLTQPSTLQVALARQACLVPA